MVLPDTGLLHCPLSSSVSQFLGSQMETHLELEQLFKCFNLQTGCGVPCSYSLLEGAFELEAWLLVAEFRVCVHPGHPSLTLIWTLWGSECTQPWPAFPHNSESSPCIFPALNEEGLGGGLLRETSSLSLPLLGKAVPDHFRKITLPLSKLFY